MYLQPWHRYLGAPRGLLHLQLFPLRFEPNPSKAVLRGECDADVVDRHHLLAQRNIIGRQRMMSSRVEVVEEMNDQLLRRSPGLAHQRDMYTHWCLGRQRRW